MVLRLKKGLRAFGVAESFLKEMPRSNLAGVVMRADLIIDGFSFGYATVGGDDATERIAEMYEKLNRNDVNLIMLDGVVISEFNIIDVDALYRRTRRPVIALTFEESEGLEEHIKRKFPSSWLRKLESYYRLGGRERVRLKTGFEVFVRVAGKDLKLAKKCLDMFTVQGGIPEPIKVAKLLARAKLRHELESNF